MEKTARNHSNSGGASIANYGNYDADESLNNYIKTMFDDGLEAHVVKNNAITWLMDMPHIRESLLADIVSKAIDRVLHRVKYKSRTGLLSSVPDNPAGLFLEAEERLMNYRLTTGKLLRDATQNDLKYEHDFYRKQAVTMDKQANWFALIVRDLPPAETVGQKYSEGDLVKLKKEAGFDAE